MRAPRVSAANRLEDARHDRQTTRSNRASGGEPGPQQGASRRCARCRAVACSDRQLSRADIDRRADRAVEYVRVIHSFGVVGIKREKPALLTLKADLFLLEQNQAGDHLLNEASARKQHYRDEQNGLLHDEGETQHARQH